MTNPGNLPLSCKALAALHHFMGKMNTMCDVCRAADVAHMRPLELVCQLQNLA